ncbi:hypothetical protein MA20_32140 [Bradyrhizobium japonicum]|uniref:Uncharacterized protein n=1 Tax=Bradyrhizobium japonicum TaxID=375 RepID=A0A0A3XN76_BRAJP|nr:hypothetical protein [Bradyrhizobium japonicum]KGT75840.1 hypothetical protein MA20_32140 [Bradyrhizobium japonicum]
MTTVEDKRREAILTTLDPVGFSKAWEAFQTSSTDLRDGAVRAEDDGGACRLYDAIAAYVGHAPARAAQGAAKPYGWHAAANGLFTVDEHVAEVWRGHMGLDVTSVYAAQPPRMRLEAIEECAVYLEHTSGKHSGADFAKAIRALAAQPPAAPVEMETCGICMGSGYSNHPDRGEICATCNGSGGVAPLQRLSAASEPVTKEALMVAGKRAYLKWLKSPHSVNADMLFEEIAREVLALLPGEPQASSADTAHALNEWADLGSNALQWLRNIKDGISTADEALAEMKSNYDRVLALSRAQPQAANAIEMDQMIERMNRALAKADYEAERAGDLENELDQLRAEPQAATEYAWLIEAGWTGTASIEYWCGCEITGGGGVQHQWSFDHSRAIRFARKEDAKRTASILIDGEAYRIVERGWDAAPPLSRPEGKR